MMPSLLATSTRSPIFEMPSPYMMSNSTSLKGGATLFLTISNLSSAQQNSLTSSISGQVAGLGSAGANFANAINAANQSGNLTIQVAANGAGFADLNDLVTQARANTNAFDSIKNAFSRYMKQFTIAQAQTTSFTYAPMSNFLVKGTNSLPSGKVAKLTEIYDSYYDVIGKAKLLNDILNSQYYLDFHNNSDALEAIRLANQFKSAQNSLIAAYNACKANSCADIFTCCIYPTFNFNSALFDKFLKSPFSNCNNDLWSERYSSKGIFTFTSVADQTFYLNQDFYNCSSSNPILAGKEVQTNFWCNVFNTGYAGGPGYVPGGIMFYVNTSEEQYNSNIGYGAYIAGNCPISGNHISLVGSNGMISAQVLLTAVGADNPYLILRKGAQMKMTIVDPSPPIEAFITPSDATICKGSSITLSANACNDCKYSWSFNSIPTGDTTQSINVSPNISGHYTVSITNSIGSNISYWSNITVTQSPNTPIITGSSTICQGSYNLLTANSLGCTNCSYTWLPNNQIGSSIYTNTPNIYTVKASNGCLPDATSLPKTLTSIQPPSTPSFTINGCSLVLPQINYVKYQWYLNDTAITGATSRFYKVKELGYYSVKITDTIIGCSSFSLDTLLNCTLGVSDKSLSNQFSIYPNPTSGLFTISLEFDKAEISVTNLIGQEIIKINTTQKSTNLQIENNGIYIVTVKTHLGTTNQKLVVNY